MRTNSFKLIGRKDNDYYFVDSVFKHRDGLAGVTGSVVRPVSPDEWEWASDRENVAERLQDGYDGDLDGDDFEDFVDRVIADHGIEYLMFDGSDRDAASEAFDDLGVEHKSTDCSGGGRIFSSINDMDFDEVYDRKALVAIAAYEDGAVSYDYAVSIIFRG